jgi:hypothetical protein
MATAEVCFDFDQAEMFFGWIYDHPLQKGDVVKMRVTPEGVTLQHIMAPELQPTMNGHNNPPELV